MARRMAALLGALALLAAACGDDDDEPAGQADAAGEQTQEAPERIVSLSPTATEILFAIGAGDQVVAVDDQSNHPAEAPVTELSGYQPNLEAIAGYEPDLVVIQDDVGDLKSGLERVGATVVVQPAPADLDGTYAQIEELGEVTGNREAATDLVEEMGGEIESLTEQARAADVEGRTYYHELEPSLFTVTSDTFIGAVYGLFGLENIADAAAGGNQYPQLSEEYVVQADPDYIFLADTKCCGQNLETVRARPGWAGLTAVQEERVVALDDDVASRWGPRVVDLVRVIADHLAGERVPG